MSVPGRRFQAESLTSPVPEVGPRMASAECQERTKIMKWTEMVWALVLTGAGMGSPGGV